MQPRMISQPTKPLTKHTVYVYNDVLTKYTIKMTEHRQCPTIMYELHSNVFLVVQCQHWQEQNIWYTIEQYAERAEWNVGMQNGDGLPAVIQL